MVIDTSALLAIAFAEPESARFIKAIVEAPEPVIAAPTLVEAAAVLMARTGAGAEVALDALLHRLAIEVVPMTPAAAEAARHAYARFGKGVGRPGVLNYGDCLSYGVAVDRGVPLLFKGEDFGRTDVDQAQY